MGGGGLGGDSDRVLSLYVKVWVFDAMPKFTQKLWTLSEAAAETGITRETIKRGLSRAEIKIDASGKFTTKQLLAAITGDLKMERARETRARANLLELEEREKKRELVPSHEVASIVNRTVGTLAESVRAMPSALARKTNPTDPEHARKAIAQTVDKILSKVREHVAEITDPDNES